MKEIRFRFIREADKDAPLPKPKDKFILDWTKALGWKRNPFKPEIDDPSSLVAGYEKERTKMNLFVIKKYDFGIIEGEEGKGKTTLLKWMGYELRKYKHTLYSAYMEGKELTGIHTSIKKIIWPTLRPDEKLITKPYMKLDLNNIIEFLRKKIGRKPLLIIIDDVKDVSDVASVLLKKLFTSGLPVQLIISGTEAEIKKSELSQLTAREKLHIILRDMDFEEAKKMIMKRVESVGGSGIQPFTEPKLEKLFSKAKKNPGKFLQLCYSEAAETAVESWQNEQEKLREKQEQLKAEQIAILKEQRKLEAEEKDFLEEIKKSQGTDAGKKQELLKEKEKSDLKRKELEDQKKQLEVTEKELKEDIISLKKDGFKASDLGGDENTRRRRLESEKKLSGIFSQIKENLKNTYKDNNDKKKDDDEEGLF